MDVNEITGEIIRVAIDIHRELGPGLLESVYRKILAVELRRLGFHVAEELPVPVNWKEIRVELGFRADLVVNNAVVIETKSTEAVVAVHKKQLLTYMRVMDKRVGLLINFGEVLLKDGLHRIVNNLEEPIS